VNPLTAHPVPGAIDVTRPHPARTYDYYLGGKDHWQADREAAEQILAVAPEVRAMARANRAFLRRAVTYLAKEKGVTQFLDVGTGIPTSPNVHETAAAHARDTRVVYADNDPVIHAHANALLTGTGTTRIILAEVTGTATTTYDSATAPLVLRPRPAIEAFLAGFTAEPPGLVQAPLWHPDAKPKPADLKKTGIYAAVAAKN
jgi:hypothetical protein